MKALQAFRVGVDTVVGNAKKRDTHRAKMPEGIRVLHASDLGKCPVRLYYELMAYEQSRDRGYSRQLFLEDGFTHENALRDILAMGMPEGQFISGNIQVPALKISGTNVEVWGEADIICYEHNEQGVNHTPLWVVESKAVYHNTFEKYVNDPSTIPFFYFVQLAFYIVRLEAEEGTLIIKDRERSEYYPDPRVDKDEPNMTLSNKQAHALIDSMADKVQAVLKAPPTIPDNVLEECRFCLYHKTCYSNIIVGAEHEDVEPLILVGKTDGLSKNISEAIRAARDMDTQMKALKTSRAAINEDLTAILHRGGLKKIVATTGTVIEVTRKGSVQLTKEAKGKVESMKKSGELATETSPSSHYLRYGRGVEGDAS